MALKTIHTNEHGRLCALLRQTRIDRGLSQSTVAERLEVPQSFVSKVENGERRIDILELRKLCRALDIPLRKLVQRLEEELQ